MAPEWVPLQAAAEMAGLEYERFRRLVKAGLFSKTSFSSAKKQPPVFVDAAEVRVFATGGAEAVRRRQGRKAKRTGKGKRTRAK